MSHDWRYMATGEILCFCGCGGGLEIGKRSIRLLGLYQESAFIAGWISEDC